MSQNSKKLHSRTSTRQSPSDSNNNSDCILPLPPYTYSSSILPEDILKQVDDGWRALCSKNTFLTLSIPETYQTLFDEGMKPKPFPMLPNLFEKQETVRPLVVSGDEKNERNGNKPRMIIGVAEMLQRSQSFHKNPTSFHSNSSHRSLSASCSRTELPPTSPSTTQYRDRAGLRGRPSSAPQAKTRSVSNSNSSQLRSTSAESGRLGKSKVIHANVPDEHAPDNGGHTTPSKEESLQAIHQRRHHMHHQQNSNEYSRNSGTSQRSAGISKNAAEAPLKSKNSQGQTTITEKLLNMGKTIVDKCKPHSSPYLHEVADKLHSLVMVELQVLREENDRLGLENLKLRDDAVIDTTSRRSGRGGTLRRITASPVQLIKLPGDSQIRSVSLPRTEKSHNNQNEDITEKVDVLEKTVALLMDQIGKIQDRLYQQEIRYEDTLGKFDDIVAQLTKKYLTALDQATSNNTLELNETLSQLGEATEQLKNITKSNRKVQFKGILKK